MFHRGYFQIRPDHIEIEGLNQKQKKMSQSFQGNTMAMELEPRTFLSASTDGFTNTSGLADGIKLYPSQFGRDLIYRIY